MRLFRTRVLLAVLSLSCLALFSACDSVFTTSLGSWLAREIDYSSLSLDELLQLAATRGVTNSDEAKKILAALAAMSEDALAALSVEQKSAILNTAINATFSMDSLLSLVDSVSDEDADSALEQIYNLANSDIDMTAVSIILQDEETLASADVDTILLASVALVTATADDESIDSLTNAISDAVESGSTDSLDESLSDELLETAETVYNVVTALEDRDLSGSIFGDYIGVIFGDDSN